MKDSWYETPEGLSTFTHSFHRRPGELTEGYTLVFPSSQQGRISPGDAASAAEAAVRRVFGDEPGTIPVKTHVLRHDPQSIHVVWRYGFTPMQVHLRGRTPLQKALEVAKLFAITAALLPYVVYDHLRTRASIRKMSRR